MFKCSIFFSLIPLLLFTGILPATAQDTWPILFFDDFSNGTAANWTLVPGWVIEQDGDGNYVLSGTGHSPFASTGNPLWGNYRLRARVRILQGGAHINFRFQQNLGKRYFIGVYEGSLTIKKQIGEVFYDLASAGVPSLTADTWHSVEVSGEGGLLSVSVDGQEYISVTDADDPITHGSVSFESLPGSHVHFDDVEVAGEPTPDIPVWTQTNGPDGGIVRAFAMNRDNGTLFVGAPDAGIFRSVDNGKHWQKSNLGIGYSNFIFHITVAPDHSNTVYAVFVNGGAFKSLDDGQSWSAINNGLDGQKPCSITVDPTNPQVLYLGTKNGRIFKSSDAGGNWQNASTGLPIDATFSISRIIVHPLNPEIVYASTGWWDDSPGIGLLRSIDGGGSWQQINTGLEGVPTFSTIAMDPQHPETLFAAGGNNFREEPVPGDGVYKTLDGGNSWRKVLGTDQTAGYGQSVTVGVNPENPTIVYAGVGKGIFKSIDAGETWVALESVPPIPVVTHLIAGAGATVYVTGYYGGVSISNDNGFTWVYSTLGFNATRIHGLGVTPSDSNIVYAGTRGDGQFMTIDGGRTWRRFEKGLDFFGGTSWAINPTDPDTVYAGTYYAFPGRVYRTVDAGGSWQKMLDTGKTECFCDDYYVNSVAIDPFNSSSVLAALLGQGIYRSSDRGGSWSLANNGLSSLQVTSLVFDPHQSGTLFAGTLNGGVFKSVDGGDSWAAVNSGITDINIWSLAIDPASPGMIYAGSGSPLGSTAPGSTVPENSNSGRIFKSIDSGVNWTEMYTSSDPESIWAITVNPADHVVYAAGHLVLMSVDGGLNWVEGGQLIYDPDNLTHPPEIRSLGLDGGGNTLYAGTIEGGVFRAVINKNAGLRLSLSLTQWVEAGTVATFIFTLRNTGNFLDSYDVQASSASDWSVVYTNSVSLDYGKETLVSVSVNVPQDADTGTVETLRLTVKSAFDPDVIATTSGTIHVVGPSAPFSGLVVDNNGQPVEGVTVRVRGSDNSTVTNNSGFFTLAGMDGQVRLTSAKAGYYTAETIAMRGQSGLVLQLAQLPVDDNTAYDWLSYRPGWMNPDNCGNCHSSIVEQWRSDAHSRAATNPVFFNVYNGTDSQNAHGVLPGLQLDLPGQQGNCASCHAPMAASSGNYDMNSLAPTQREGVACDFCHKINGVLTDINGLTDQDLPGVQSIELLRPNESNQVFFGPLDDVPAPDSYHPLQAKSRLCAPCHNASFNNTPVYQSYSEWLSSPYAQKGIECQGCHMLPSGITNIAPGRGGFERDPATLHSHLMPGSANNNLLQQAVTLTAKARRTHDRLTVDVSLTNSGAGHHVPTDQPMRNMLLVVTVENGNGQPLTNISNAIIPDWGGDYAGLPGKGFAKILSDLSTGQTPATSYWNPTSIISDNRIPAMATDSSTLVFSVPNQSQQLIVEIRVIYRRAFQPLATLKGWNVSDIIMAEKIFTVGSEIGDVNGDWTVDIRDVILIMQMITGQSRPVIPDSADVNFDGKIDLAEAIYILQQISGLAP